ncbi:MAG TPA: preprotein translocase subunit SecG [Pyrinomonadaceae bacterium]|nr:preprotein translocase subunit SecG [Pyrinomonadaceae bacterium]
MLTYILYGLFILSCLVLVIVVLLQPGKSSAGELFSSTLSSTAFGPRGTATVLAKITIGAAAAFMLVALMLSLPAITGSYSVLQSTEAEASPSPTPQASPSPDQAAPSPTTSAAGSPAASPSPSK